MSKGCETIGKSSFCVVERWRVADTLFCKLTVSLFDDELLRLCHLADEFCDALRLDRIFRKRERRDGAVNEFTLRQ